VHDNLVFYKFMCDSLPLSVEYFAC